MWTPRRLRFARRSERRTSDGRGAGRWPESAFTLIELLVVVAIIAVLISILLPSLSSAREQARAVVCGQHLRGFGNGLQLYTAENQDWIPGCNTSGVSLLSKRFIWGQDIGALYNSKLCMQPFDWMTPILAYETELPAERAERFKFLLDHFRCPSQFYTSVVWDGSAAPDLSRFYDYAPWPGVSYLMSVHFQYVGQNQKKRLVGTMQNQSFGVPIYASVAGPDWEVRVDDYLPRINQLGAPANKVFVADGTRWVDEGGLLDHDVSVAPGFFGAFCSTGAWWSGSRAYGVKPGTPNWDDAPVGVGSPSSGLNLGVSYRHGRRGSGGSLSGDARDNKGAINTVFFDGHVERLGDRESREAQLWYPSGAVVQTPSEGMTSLPKDFVIP